MLTVTGDALGSLDPTPKLRKQVIRVRGFPERDILSLRTLGLGLARFGRPSAGAARPNWLILKSEVSEKTVSVRGDNLTPYF